ncbi:ribonuclease TUDOR 2-like protein [Tanacetum coccineum]|uniref:Ribonuclease TUDOR 2-like protein n=1 Tax=Tanacetum coccineum TaxID=301880 RepID=A0ABQ5FYT0_9ASTR
MEIGRNRLKSVEDGGGCGLQKAVVVEVVEVVSGDCIIIADDALSFGSPAVEFKFQLSMEYSRKVHVADGSAAQAGSADSRVMGFGSVFLLSEAKGSEDVNSTTATPPAAATQQPDLNVAELIIARGFGTVIRHREFEERSNHYKNLLASESCATTRRKGIHSAKDPPSMHVTDLLAGSAKKAKDFLPFLQRKRRMTVVEYVLSGHRFKLFVPNETCSIAFSLSGVRCPGRDEPYSNDAISLMRCKIMQRDVEIEVETVARTGTFIGSLWESKTNVGDILLEEVQDYNSNLTRYTLACGEVDWGKVSMVDAEKRLLANALEDLDNEHFVLVSDRDFENSLLLHFRKKAPVCGNASFIDRLNKFINLYLNGTSVKIGVGAYRAAGSCFFSSQTWLHLSS